MLLSWAEPAWRAWEDLGSERPHAVMGFAAPMGAMEIRARPLALTWSSVQAWCDRARCGSEDREMIAALLAALDREYLAWWARQNRG